MFLQRRKVEELESSLDVCDLFDNYRQFTQLIRTKVLRFRNEKAGNVENFENRSLVATLMGTTQWVLPSSYWQETTQNKNYPEEAAQKELLEAIWGYWKETIWNYYHLEALRCRVTFSEHRRSWISPGEDNELDRNCFSCLFYSCVWRANVFLTGTGRSMKMDANAIFWTLPLIALIASAGLRRQFWLCFCPSIVRHSMALVYFCSKNRWIAISDAKWVSVVE